MGPTRPEPDAVRFRADRGGGRAARGAPGTTPPGGWRRLLRPALGLALGLLAPVLLYYVLRGFGVSVYVALVVTALVSALPSAVQLVRRRRVNRIASYFCAMSVAALLISLLPGSTEFLLAKGAVLTGVTGVLFLLSLRAEHPIVFVLTRPLLEGRMNWPADWERLHGRSSRFRRMWRVATIMWGTGLILDAAGRVFMAFAFDPDTVPALSSALYVVVIIALNVATNGYYIACGVFRRGSRLYELDRGP